MGLGGSVTIPSVIKGFSGEVLDAILHEWNPIEPIYDITHGIGACWKNTCGRHEVVKLDRGQFNA